MVVDQMGAEDPFMPPEELTEAARLFCDDDLSITEKRTQLTELANLGNTEARGYLEGLSRVERGALAPIEGLLCELALELGELISQRCREKGLERINERDHLQPWSAEALGRLAESRPQFKIAASVPVEYPEKWPRLGPVDVSLTDAASNCAFVELKCGSKSDAFGPCAWDVLKLAFLLRVEACSGGYLMGAAPRSAWEQPIRGAEFFSYSEWSAAQIRERYTDWYRDWENDGYRPLRIPDSGWTRPVASADFEITGAPWQLRIASVRTSTDGWIDWESVLDPS